ncbi:MAG TPA: hypothetical protein VIY09_05970 [Rhizomicrobium sp.]
MNHHLFDPAWSGACLLLTDARPERAFSRSVFPFVGNASASKKARGVYTMRCSKYFGATGLAAFAGLAMMAALPAVAQTRDQTTPPTQTYQNNTGSMQGANGMNGSSQMNSSGMTTKASTKGESLNHVKDAKTTLASALVQDSSGQLVGQVSDVHTSRSGSPTKVDITLSSTNGGKAKTISVSASKLRYDRSDNTLITNLSASNLQAMPSASSSSGM